MDIQLKELIETIKKEGIDSADSRAAQIIAEAETKARAIVARAEEDAVRILADAKREIERTEQSSKEALVQAGRDLILGLEKRIIALFDGVIKTQSGEALQGRGLEDAVAGLVRAWAAKGPAGLEVLLPAEELKKIEGSLRAKLSEELKKGLVLKPVPQIEAGFRIGESGGSAHYDFTAEGVAEILAEYLNPRLAGIMKSLSKGV
ncbi:MAG: V-type ATP synthase subunit E [Spirochaetales bacterium]|jgi:V/A-type H+-transporting ATPase subunit E|nr:V-type ATP synthase subunit E [Spirochaetales bacterium]